MKWRDISDDWWTIPGSFAKNGLAHRVPITRAAKAFVQPSAHEASEYVFPNLTGTEPAPYDLIRKTFTSVRRNIGLDDLRPHDLRRTVASHLAGMGVGRLVLGKVLNHAERGVTAVYDRHSYDAEKRYALERWAAKCFNEAAAVNVVQLHGPN